MLQNLIQQVFIKLPPSPPKKIIIITETRGLDGYGYQWHQFRFSSSSELKSNPDLVRTEKQMFKLIDRKLSPSSSSASRIHQETAAL